MGMAIVVLAAVAFIVFAAWRQMFWIGATILLAAAVIDAVLYAFVGNVTVCYRCRTEFRGPVNPRHHGFELAVGEKHRHS
jgi:hypothetical protein